MDAPKDQQIAGGALLRESVLHDAFANPGPLNQAPGAAATHPTVPEFESAYSIGKPDDAQLKAALDFLVQVPDKESRK